MCIPDFPSLNLEALATLGPQLVLASTLTYATDVQKLTIDYHLPVVLLAPSTLDGVSADVSLVAQMFPGAQRAATALVAELRSVVFNATTFDANLSQSNVTPPSVLLTYYFDSGGYYSYGPGSFGQSLIELAGGSSVAAGQPLLYGELNASTVLVENPSVILYGTSWNDPYIVSDETPSNWSSAPYWGQLTGVKIPLDIALVTEPDPTMVLELPQLIAWLHPGAGAASA
jgi:iron complex transport system substrate-binding protein